MVLLIRDNCQHCVEFENIRERFPEIFMFKVINGMTDIGDGVMRPIDSKIESLPALITDNSVYMGADHIREQIKLYAESLGENS
jgi:hypothetical protein